ERADATWFINGRLLPDANLLQAMETLEHGTVLCLPDGIELLKKADSAKQKKIYEHPVVMIRRPQDLFLHNAEQIKADFAWITRGRESAPLDSSNKVIGEHPVFLEPGAKASCSIFNTTEGPVYLDADSEVMEGSLVRGPFSLGAHSQLKMGTRIYTGTSIGPHCKMGGEINNSVVLGYSNKAHEGFLGNSVIGTWCNLGADSNNSNLKNNYDEVKLWHYGTQRFEKTGLQFCGLIMGDHSKCGINTMFNTGTVVGVACNVFGAGFPRNFIPDFAWGGAAGFVTHKPEQAITTVRRVFERRKKTLSEAEEQMLRSVFAMTKELRNWED
ncbi:MAG: glucose-1-phosphate thymidylyltransferase, partial [Bacteroidetes bacterium]|nr:glucose-1-phosphate thymidylyltransferase [Bacteroidota bacterium]